MSYKGANFEGVDLDDYQAFYCNFDGADLRNTKGWNVVTGSTFRGADFRGADLRTMTTVPDVSVFAGALYDDATIWPDWIDMSKLRAVKKEGAE